MKTFLLPTLALTAAIAGAQAADTLPPAAQRFQDHIAYVATFAMPVLIERCAADDPDYLQAAAPAYFRFVNTRQDAIERGRLLTLAELAPDDTLQRYRQRVLESRLAPMASGSDEQRRGMCAGALAMLRGEAVPQGTWPSD